MPTTNSWPATPAPGDREIDRHVEAFEHCFRSAGDATIEWFLPAPEGPLFLPVLRELVRVDLEFRWSAGRPAPLDTYRARFPQLFSDRASLRDIIFEEFRLRRQAGETPTPEEYLVRYGIEPVESEHTPPPGPAPAGGPGEELTHRCDDIRGYTALRAIAENLSAAPVEGSARAASVEAFAAFQRADPGQANRLAAAVAELPQAGGNFAEFHLLSELGRGAFGRVFLASQADLAGRLVALKISPGTDGGEARKLAQLQHTNVVPVYSLHRQGRLQAVCMPFYGSTTLAHVLDVLRGHRALPASGQGLLSTLQGRRSTQVNTRTGSAPGGEGQRTEDRGQKNSDSVLGPPSPVPLSSQQPAATATLDMLAKLSYVEAVVWLGARLADGLAHAHERGILHRDIKPQNILLTDEGQPMLLDFNLAEDQKDTAAGVKAQMGGTLPYMAPEHLEAFRGGRRPIDARADLYGLGVLLYELLAGSPPFPARQGPFAQVVDEMVADRRSHPALAALDRSVPPAVAAVVGKLLAFDPAERYPNARQLQEDLERQLTHRPLAHAPNPSFRELVAKWRRRHPRLSSTATVTALAGVLAVTTTAAAVHSRRELARAEATAQVAHDRTELAAAEYYLLPWADRLARPGQGDEIAGRILDRYGVGRGPDWLAGPTLSRLSPAERDRWRIDLGRVLVLQASAGVRRAKAAQARGDGRALRDRAEAALEANRRAEDCFPEPPAFLWAQRADLLDLLGQPGEARAARDRVAQAADDGFSRIARAVQLVAVEHHDQARAELERMVQDDPANDFLWFVLGYCEASLDRLDKAEAAFTACIALQPAAPRGYLSRALLRLHREEFAAARADLDAAIRLQPDFPDAYVARAQARQRLENGPSGPLADLDEALRRGGPPCQVHALRAVVLEKAGDQAGAERERAEALQTDPAGDADWVARGLVRLRIKQYEAALADFEKALSLNNQSRDALHNKAHILSERLPRPREALAVLNQLVELYPDHLEGRTGRAVLLARMGEDAGARRDADYCLARRGLRPLLLYQLACVYAQTSQRDPADRATALELLRRAFREGFNHPELANDILDRDADLKPLFADARFQELARWGRDLLTPAKE
jgi:serine/threonine protein kinase/tetratricopeptide (TPR) repeat protein